MTRLAVLVMTLAAVAAMADETEKKCAALKDDGTVIAEASWQNGKSDACRKQVKEEVAKLCTAETSMVKFKLRLQQSSKPISSFVTCPKVKSATPATDAATASLDESKKEAPKSTVNVACFKACSDAQKACHDACAKGDKDCNQKCLTTVSGCNAACK